MMCWWLVVEPQDFEGDYLNGFVEDVIDEGETFAVRVWIGRS